MVRKLEICLVCWFVVATAGCERTVPVGSMDGQPCSTKDAVKSAGDGCNTCSCGADGVWHCTDRSCDEAGGTTGSGGSSQGGSTASGGTQTCCLAMATCAEDDIRIDGPEACPTGASCYSNTICCSTVWCVPVVTTCAALPVCDPGDTEITGTCPPDDSCYERTTCGTTINCRRAMNQCTAGEHIVAANQCLDCTCSSIGAWSCNAIDVCATDSCTTAKSLYSEYRQDVLTKATSVGCTTDADCKIVYESNRCQFGCGRALPVATADAALNYLEALANAICTTCPTPLALPCPSAAAHCIEGICTEGAPGAL